MSNARKIKPPNYENQEKRIWRKNAEEVVSKLDDRDKYILRKIDLYSWRFGVTKSEIEEEIRHNYMFANWFAIEPRRQGLHEKTAATWLQKHKDFIHDFLILPKSGGEAVFVTSDGEIRKIKESKAKPSKTLDFKWRTGEYEVFAAHKYTKESGGNQDSQFNEIRDLLGKFQKGSEKKNRVLLAIVDGAYYTDSKIEKLTKMTRDKPPKSYVANIGQVIDILRKLK